MKGPKKILLVQLYSNGDCLYATAVARQIKQDFPGCHLTWAIASFCKGILDGNPYVDALLEVDSVAKNDVAAFRHFRKQLLRQKREGKFDEVFITQNIDRNHAFYDGSIRSSILKAYQRPITVPVTPVLRLSAQEIENARKFSQQHHFHEYSKIVLFEFAPQSGQLTISKDAAIAVAEAIVQSANTAVVLSSALKINHPDKRLIDGSFLTLRETAALTHYCDLLLGSSSGITWISTTDAAKQLPMVQILNPDTTWVNPVSRDFHRFGFPEESVIELMNFEQRKVVRCVVEALQDFLKARERFNQPVPLHFKTTRSIVYNLLVYFEWGAIARHIKVNRQVYGDKWAFYRELILGFLLSPITLIKNYVRKNF